MSGHIPCGIQYNSQYEYQLTTKRAVLNLEIVFLNGISSSLEICAFIYALCVSQCKKYIVHRLSLTLQEIFIPSVNINCNNFQHILTSKTYFWFIDCLVGTVLRKFIWCISLLIHWFSETNKLYHKTQSFRGGGDKIIGDSAEKQSPSTDVWKKSVR